MFIIQYSNKNLKRLTGSHKLDVVFLETVVYTF